MSTVTHGLYSVCFMPDSMVWYKEKEQQMRQIYSLKWRLFCYFFPFTESRNRVLKHVQKPCQQIIKRRQRQKTRDKHKIKALNPPTHFGAPTSWAALAEPLNFAEVLWADKKNSVFAAEKSVTMAPSIYKYPKTFFDEITLWSQSSPS